MTEAEVLASLDAEGYVGDAPKRTRMVIAEAKEAIGK
jgi:hypothetical protein